MTLGDVLQLSLVTNSTHISIENKDGVPIAAGNWYQDQILKYGDCNVLEMDLYGNDMNKVVIRLDVFLFI